MSHVDAACHVTGRSLYLDDLPRPAGTLFAVPFDSPIAHGRITRLDTRAARACPGVVAVLTAADIPGENQIGGIIPDEPLLADGEVHFVGMPVALVIASSDAEARAARARIVLEVEALEVVTDPRDARARGELIVPARTFRKGDTAAAWSHCAHVFEGRADTNGQEHLYLETQGALAIPTEQDGMRVSSSTQGPTAVQRTVARVLGVPMHRIEVDVTRLGGGFGGKEDQASTWAALAALAAQVLRRPVSLVLHRMDDLRMTGKRHPYSSDFRIGLDADLRIVAYEVTFHQNAGAAADLSPAVLERTLFHATNAYAIEHVTATAYSCRTHLPPNTAFRGFGGPQGMFVIEAAIALAASRLGVPARVIQARNLMAEGDTFPYGQRADRVHARASWDLAMERFGVESQAREVAAFNAANHLHVRGMAMMPICFGISFTNTPMNQAAALVHVYQDGSVGVSTAAVEMGQGVRTKMAMVAADAFALPLDRIRIESTNTTRVANTSPSAASATADLNGKALEIACAALRERLLAHAASRLGIERARLSLREGRIVAEGSGEGMAWTDLVRSAQLARVDLSEHAHYATPDIHFDKSAEKGHPFAYHVYGTAAITVTVDRLRGTYVIDAVDLVHDFGVPLHSAIDIGQVEGGLAQGLGWMTLEEVVFDREGRLRSGAMSTYKVPDLHAAPNRVRIVPLPGEGHPMAIRRSKAVGEPPLMYGIGAYFALLDAVRTANPGACLRFDAPFTPEKVLLALCEGPPSAGGPAAPLEDAQERS